MKINIITIVFFLLSTVACAQQVIPSAYKVIDFDEDLKSYLFTKFDDFQITEIFSKKDNKESFFRKSLGGDFVKETIKITSREILFKDLSVKSDSHVGLAILNYSNAQSAQQAIKNIEHSGYFENTKILTKYVLKNTGHQNIVLYTESAGDSLATDYIEQYFKK